MRTKVQVLFVGLGLFLSSQTHADSPLCAAGSAAWRTLTQIERNEKVIGQVQPTHQVKLLNGFDHFSTANFRFDDRANPMALNAVEAVPVITPWATGDIGVVRLKESEEQVKKGERNPIQLFVQKDIAPYQGENDKGTDGGIYKVSDYNGQGVQCPTEPFAYEYHQYPKQESKANELQLNGVYCVRTRDGKRFALMKIEALCDQAVVFAYIYGGASSYFAPTSPPISSPK
jgi:hypothetical protein